MTSDLQKLCRSGRNPEHPSVVRIGPPIHRIPKGSLTCQDCGFVDLPDDLRERLAAKAIENQAAAERRSKA